MITVTIQDRDFSSEFKFSASRSGGPGGQNVNKVSSKIELRFSIDDSNLLSDEEKVIIRTKLINRINKEGELLLVAQTERSQLANKEKVIEKFYNLIDKALSFQKKRRPTKPSRSSKEKRLEGKKINADKKTSRKRIVD